MTDYLFKPGDNKLAPLLLLHSTGGDEQQLLPLAELVAPGHPILSIAGRVNPDGPRRYFKLRGTWGFTPDNFDLNSLAKESQWLSQTIIELSQKHELDLSRMIALGYSNGANILLDMLLSDLIAFDNSIAFHAMRLKEHPTLREKKSRSLFLTYAKNDEIVPLDNFKSLKTELESAGCRLTVFESTLGHQLSEEEVWAAKQWLTDLSAATNKK